MARIQASTTTDAQYRLAISSFARCPDPPGTMLTWVCRNNADYLDLAEDPLMFAKISFWKEAKNPCVNGVGAMGVFPVRAVVPEGAGLLRGRIPRTK